MSLKTIRDQVAEELNGWSILHNNDQASDVYLYKRILMRSDSDQEFIDELKMELDKNNFKNPDYKAYFQNIVLKNCTCPNTYPLSPQRII